LLAAPAFNPTARSAAAIGLDELAGNGVLYHGLEVLGGGAILTGLVLAATAIFVIDRKFMHAAAFAFAGAVLTFFGFMHGEHVGIAVTPSMALAYAVVAVFLLALGRYPAATTAAAPEPDGHETVAVPAE
jgi:AGZA family xanthine/uracil permease-like MFS transporter